MQRATAARCKRRRDGQRRRESKNCRADWPAPERAWLHAFIDAIRTDYADIVQRAVLFGSKSRGDWKQWSDIDILVIIRDEGRERSEEIDALSDELPPSRRLAARGADANRNRVAGARRLARGFPRRGRTRRSQDPVRKEPATGWRDRACEGPIASQAGCQPAEGRRAASAPLRGKGQPGSHTRAREEGHDDEQPGGARTGRPGTGRLAGVPARGTRPGDHERRMVLRGTKAAGLHAVRQPGSRNDPYRSSSNSSQAREPSTSRRCSTSRHTGWTRRAPDEHSPCSPL